MLLVFSLSLTCLGQNDLLRFERIGMTDGLSQSWVSDIHQDHLGFMWFATQDGLNKYDGRNLKIFRPEPNNPKSLTRTWIQEIAQSGDQRIWLVNDIGQVSRFNREDESFTLLNDANTGIEGFELSGWLYMDVDPFGDLWLAGPRQPALVRYRSSDQTFEEIRLGPDIPNPQSVLSVGRDQEDHVWIYTASGNLIRYDLHQKAAEVFIPPQSTGLFGIVTIPAPSGRNSGQSMLLLDDQIWFGLSLGNLYCFDRKSQTFTKLDNPLFGNTQIIVGHGEYVWVYFRDGTLQKIHRRSLERQTYRHDPKNPMSPPPPLIADMLVDQRGILWIASSANGLARYDAKKDHFIHERNDPSNPLSLSGDALFCIYEDPHQNIWIGTLSEGVSAMIPDRQKFQHFYSDMVWGVSEGRSGILLATESDGLYHLDNDYQTVLEHFHAQAKDPKYRIMGNRVQCATYIPGNGLWFVAHSVKNNSGHLYHVDPEGNLRQGTTLPRVLHIKQSKFFPDHLLVPFGSRINLVHKETMEITSLGSWSRFNAFGMVDFVEDDQYIYMATFNGLLRLNIAAKEIKSFLSGNSTAETSTNGAILCILRDRDGIIWNGTLAGGLNRFDPQTETFQFFTTADGLANNVIYAILEEPNGALWLSSNNGLTRFEPNTGKVRNFNISHGLQSNEFNQGARLKRANGEMIFGGVNGINVFRPEDVLQPAEPPRLIAFASKNTTTVLQNEITKPTKLVLEPDDELLEIDYVAIDYKSEDNRYSYQMSGIHSDWVPDTEGRGAAFTSLPPGKYQFKIKAASSGDNWTEPMVIDVEAKPHFYETALFGAFLWMSGLILVIGLIFAIWRHHLAQMAHKELTRKTEELEYARAMQLAMLPHKDFHVPGVDLIGHMVTATEVGGDYYDFFQLDDRHLLIAYGDATGHGVAAGLVVGMTKMACTVVNPRRGDLASVMADLNTGLKRSLTVRHMGMALGLVLVDLETREAEICLAGMPTPFHYCAATKELKPVVLKAPPLGYLSRINLPTVHLNLQPNDQLVMVTDGFAERFNDDNLMWGETNLRNSLERICQQATSPADAVSRLIIACDHHANGRPNDDDMTVVLLKVQDQNKPKPHQTSA